MGKKMKKCVSIVLMLVLVIGLVGCGSDTEGGDVQKVDPPEQTQKEDGAGSQNGSAELDIYGYKENRISDFFRNYRFT